jgi:hypothetical protein
MIDSQTLLNMDPGLVVQNVTINSTQLLQIRQEIFSATLYYMEIALLVGAIIGVYVGWSWREYYYNKKPKRKPRKKVTNGSDPK